MQNGFLLPMGSFSLKCPYHLNFPDGARDTLYGVMWHIPVSCWPGSEESQRTRSERRDQKYPLRQRWESGCKTVMIYELTLKNLHESPSLSAKLGQRNSWCPLIHLMQTQDCHGPCVVLSCPMYSKWSWILKKKGDQWLCVSNISSLPTGVT